MYIKIIIVYLYIYKPCKYVLYTRSVTQDKGVTHPSPERANEDSRTVIFRLISGHEPIRTGLPTVSLDVCSVPWSSSG